LLQNPAFGKNIDKFISKFPVADIRSPTEKILESFSRDENIEGILIVDNMRYVGFLSASSLLKTLNEKNLAAASDQNPLSKLPGSTLVYEYISSALRDTKSSYMFAYFDFDNFKFYNDKYGFREGDRVILLFSELLRKMVTSPDHFAGHIGGDDFFMGIREASMVKTRIEIKQLLEVFHRNAESFYDPASIKKGYIVSWLPDKKIVNIPLLAARSTILEMPASRLRFLSVKEITNIAEKHSKEAKDNPDKICSVCLGDIHKHPDNPDEFSHKDRLPFPPASVSALSSGLVSPAII
jgi:diguanylate cyclase (GGDEF)-like protein